MLRPGSVFVFAGPIRRPFKWTMRLLIKWISRRDIRQIMATINHAEAIFGGNVALWIHKQFRAELEYRAAFLAQTKVLGEYNGNGPQCELVARIKSKLRQNLDWMEHCAKRLEEIGTLSPELSQIRKSVRESDECLHSEVYSLAGNRELEFKLFALRQHRLSPFQAWRSLTPNDVRDINREHIAYVKSILYPMDRHRLRRVVRRHLNRAYERFFRVVNPHLRPV